MGVLFAWAHEDQHSSGRHCSEYDHVCQKETWRALLVLSLCEERRSHSLIKTHLLQYNVPFVSAEEPEIWGGGYGELISTSNSVNSFSTLVFSYFITSLYFSSITVPPLPNPLCWPLPFSFIDH